MTVRPGRRERANMTFIVPRRNIGPSYFSLLSLTSTYPNRYPCPLQDTTVTLPNTTHTATTALPTLSVALSKPWLVSTLPVSLARTTAVVRSEVHRHRPAQQAHLHHEYLAPSPRTTVCLPGKSCSRFYQTEAQYR